MLYQNISVIYVKKSWLLTKLLVLQGKFVLSGLGICRNQTHVFLTFTEVEVRLVGMDTPNVGHVQVKFNGTWGTICAVHRLTYQSGEVICRQLGHGPPVKLYFIRKECTAKKEGAEIVWLSDLNCQGFEDSLDQCPHRGWGRMDPEYCKGCTPQYCSVCLICQQRDPNITGIEKRLYSFRCCCQNCNE